MMEAVMIRILNMSISAGWLMLAVMAARLLLKKAPRWITVILWGLVGLRLIMPFSISSSFSLIPASQVIRPSLVYSMHPTVSSAVTVIDDTVSPVLETSLAADPAAGVNPIQIWPGVPGAVWLAGMAVMLSYGLISHFRLRRKVAEAAFLKENIWLCDRVESPFILGVFHPQIYLPSYLEGQERKFVLAHEHAHLKRGDHLWKPLGFLLLAVYWFHPLVWISWILLGRDIEAACDEKVIRDMEMEDKKAYANALVSCSLHHRLIFAFPLAFGETAVKRRVKDILNYRKPALWLGVTALLACAAIAVCFLSDPEDEEQDLSFLNYKMAVSLIGQNGTQYALHCPAEVSEIQVGAVDDWELVRYLENCRWTKKRFPPQQPASPGSVEFVIEEGYRITVYQKPVLARVQSEEKTRYYRTGPDDYEKALELFHPESPSGMTMFKGRVLNLFVQEGKTAGFLAEVTEDTASFKAGTQVTVPYEENNPSPDPAVGDMVEVAFTGEIMETRPLQISKVISVRVLPDTGVSAAPLSDRIPCVKAEGKLYLDTGKDASGMIPLTPDSSFDGAIVSEVDGSELPAENGQSNFGAGYGYKIIDENNIAVYINQKWQLFTAEEPASAKENSTSFYLTIGADGVKSIEVKTKYMSGGCENADGSPYRKGESIWLEPLDGLSDLGGVTVSALDAGGNVIWTVSVPDDQGLKRWSDEGWAIMNTSER